jgi:hypothetical protein
MACFTRFRDLYPRSLRPSTRRRPQAASAATTTTAIETTVIVRSLIEIATHRAWSSVGGTGVGCGFRSAMPEPYERHAS